MVGVRRAGLPLKLDAITKGDNNCFFNAMFAQTQRPGVAQELASGGVAGIRNPYDLRLKVARFAKRSRLAVVDEFKRRYYETYPEKMWDEMWSRMEQDEEWADAITVQATAWFLHHDINIVMASSTEEMPLTTISGSWDQEGASCDKTPLLLGYLNNTHYQSLLPEDDAVVSHENQPLMFSEIVKMVSGTHANAQQSKEDGTKKEKKSMKQGRTDEEEGYFQFLWDSEIVSLKPTKEKRMVCPFCRDEQKQIMRHIKTKHLTSSQSDTFADIEKDYKKHLNNKRVKACQQRLKEKDEEGFKQKHNKVEQDRQKRKREEDKEGFMEKHRRVEQKSMMKRRATDEEGFMENQRKRWQKSMTKRKAADEEGFLEKHRREEQKSKVKRKAADEKLFKNQQNKANLQYRRKIGRSQDAAVRKFFQETLHGPNFVCVCCRTLNFRHNMVIYDGKARVEIRKKANEAHEQEYNSKLKQV